jgi:hypothetical protein
MLLVSKFEEVPVWEELDAPVSDWLNEGQMVVWTGEKSDAGVQLLDGEWFQVLTQSGILGWVFSDNVEEVKC